MKDRKNMKQAEKQSEAKSKAKPKSRAKAKIKKQSNENPLAPIRKKKDGSPGKGRRPKNLKLSRLAREMLVHLFSIYGTYSAVAERIGFSVKHISHIVKENDLQDDIRQNKGKLAEQVFEAAARYALYGYSVESEKIMVLHNKPILDDNGNVVGIGDQIVRVPYIKHYPPFEKTLLILLNHFHGIGEDPHGSDTDEEGDVEIVYESYEEQRKNIGVLEAPKEKGL